MGTISRSHIVKQKVDLIGSDTIQIRDSVTGEWKGVTITNLMRASAIEATVETFGDLPISSAENIDEVYLVRTGTGIWLITRKPAGLYISTGSGYTYLDAFPDSFNSANFEVFDNIDNSKAVQFDVTDVATSTKRVISMPDADVDLNDVFRQTVLIHSVSDMPAPAGGIIVQPNDTDWIIDGAIVLGTDRIQRGVDSSITSASEVNNK